MSWFSELIPSKQAGKREVSRVFISETEHLGPTTHGYWVGTGRVALRYVSPCPPLDPYVRLSPHTAHDRGILWERSISPAPWCLPHGQLTRSLGTFVLFPDPLPQALRRVRSFPTLRLL